MHELRVFLCHSSVDKPAVRDLYRRLKSGGAKPWLDEEDLLPGQDWQREIPNAVKASDVVVVCLSRGAVTKAGYAQKEIQYALDVASEQPEGAIFLIPLRLEECVIPDRLQRWHWVDLFQERGYERLVRALDARREALRQIKTQYGVPHEQKGMAIPKLSPVLSPVGSAAPKKIVEMIVTQIGVDEQEVTLDASFVEDLGADSLDIIELVMAAEEEFEIEIPDEEVREIRTVRDAVNYLAGAFNLKF